MINLSNPNQTAVAEIDERLPEHRLVELDQLSELVQRGRTDIQRRRNVHLRITEVVGVDFDAGTQGQKLIASWQLTPESDRLIGSAHRLDDDPVTVEGN